MQKVAVLFVAVACAVDVNVDTNSIPQIPKIQKDAVVNNQERSADQTDAPGNDAFRSETTFTKSFGNGVSARGMAKSIREGQVFLSAKSYP